MRAQSELLAKLSKQLVSALEETLPVQAQQAAKKNPRQTRAETPTSKQSGKGPQGELLSIPVVEPVRELEVYRF